MAIEFEVHEFFRDSPDKVFAAVTDLSRINEWMPGFVAIERLTDDPFGVGTRWRETRRMFGQDASEEFDVTVCDPPRRLELHVDGTKGSSKKGEYRFVHRFVPDQGGTRVYLSGEIDGLSGLSTVVGWLMVLPFKRAVAKDLRALKHYLEGSPETR